MRKFKVFPLRMEMNVFFLVFFLCYLAVAYNFISFRPSGIYFTRLYSSGTSSPFIQHLSGWESFLWELSQFVAYNIQFDDGFFSFSFFSFGPSRRQCCLLIFISASLWNGFNYLQMTVVRWQWLVTVNRSIAGWWDTSRFVDVRKANGILNSVKIEENWQGASLAQIDGLQGIGKPSKYSFLIHVIIESGICVGCFRRHRCPR